MYKIGLNGYREKVKGSGLRWKIRTLRRELKNAWLRAWQGYDDNFWWGMDSTFMDLYSNLISEMIENGMTHPLGTDEKEWDYTLKRMKYLLDRMNIHRRDRYHFTREEKNEIEVAKQEFFKLFEKHFYELWD